MAIELTNNWIIVPLEDTKSAILKSMLVWYERGKTIYTKRKPVTLEPKYHYAYEIKDEKMYIPVGLYSMLSEVFTLDTEIIDNRLVKNPKLLETRDIESHIFDYEDILDGGYKLRKEQLIACKKILHSRRGIINAATGFGKTLVIGASIKLLQKANDNVMPTVLVFEPTVKLVSDTVKRLKEYGIDAVTYAKNRQIKPNTVNVAHPKSLGNDLQENPKLLESVEVLFGDETHHFRNNTYRTPTYDMPSLLYSIGVSASAISQEHTDNTKLSQYSYEEALVMGATGPLLLNITAEYLISKGDLASPILLRMAHRADEIISPTAKTDWHEISKTKLLSDHRNHLVSMVAEVFANKGRKVLILVNTIEWAERLLQIFNAMDLSNQVFATYGGGKFARIAEPFRSMPEPGYKDSFDRFENGEYNIMIGTTHLYEGADLKNLDVIILAYGGKAERLQVQGIGRALRKSKTGKYAYIVDFTDSEDIVLSKHSKTRLKRYREIIGIPDDNIYDNITVKDVSKILADRENV